MFTSLKVNIMVTILTIVMVFMLPWLDHFICRKLGVSLSDSISTNPDADRLLHIRKILLIIMFGVYLRAVSYVTFFSRSASDDYLLHIALFQDLGESIRIDLGFFGFIKVLFTSGFSRAMEHIKIRIPDLYEFPGHGTHKDPESGEPFPDLHEHLHVYSHGLSAALRF